MTVLLIGMGDPMITGYFLGLVAQFMADFEEFPGSGKPFCAFPIPTSASICSFPPVAPSSGRCGLRPGLPCHGISGQSVAPGKTRNDKSLAKEGEGSRPRLAYEEG
jgi:hypothetical protein